MHLQALQAAVEGQVLRRRELLPQQVVLRRGVGSRVECAAVSGARSPQQVHNQ